jgi:hypothetical protein
VARPVRIWVAAGGMDYVAVAFAIRRLAARAGRQRVLRCTLAAVGNNVKGKDASPNTLVSTVWQRFGGSLFIASFPPLFHANVANHDEPRFAAISRICWFAAFISVCTPPRTGVA